MKMQLHNLKTTLVVFFSIFILTFSFSQTDLTCLDDDALVSPLGCVVAVDALGCDFTYNGILVSDACPSIF